MFREKGAPVAPFSFPGTGAEAMITETTAGPGLPQGITLEDAIDRVAAHLEGAGLSFGHGVADAGEEAAWLLLAACGVSPDAGDIPWQRVLTDEEIDAARALAVRRVQSRKPLAYLLGEAWFAGLRFCVDERVLVPRSHFAEWVVDGFAPWVDPDGVTSVLDLCCGSGCIGIATALAMPGARVTLSDISADALAVAEINIGRHDLADRVTTHLGDGLAGLDGCYDLILCNPPYVASGRMETLPEEYRHEPALGLVAGADGLDFIAPLLEAAADYLSPGGVLMVEAGSAGAAVLARWPRIPFTWLETESGEPVLFMLTREELKQYDFRVRPAGRHNHS